jgi:hypothetical protein
MGRNREPRPNTKNRPKKLAISTTPSKAQTPDGVGVAAPKNSKEKIIKLVDVVESTVNSLHLGQAVSIVDSEVYLSSNKIGRVPQNSKMQNGNGVIRKILVASHEVWIAV